MTLRTLITGMVLLGFGAGCTSAPTIAIDCHPMTTNDRVGTTTMSLAFPGVLSANEVNKKIRLTTNQGEMLIQLDVNMGPCAASNFVYLVKQGFYDGLTFHRVIPGFMIQGGDPNGTGTGGPGYQFDNDPVTLTKKKVFQTNRGSQELPIYEDGWLAMANAGRNTNGSQFFIMVDDYPLPPDYSVFGKVISGLDVAKKISQLETDQMDMPLEPVVITKAEIVE
jgi:cyclophilin family peptidyl-prolyl cis-trans isomerase